jgi:hypothetical protein
MQTKKLLAGRGRAQQSKQKGLNNMVMMLVNRGASVYL